MVNITFDKGGDSIIVTGQIVYGTIFEDERWGQYALLTGDGQLVTYDNTGVDIVEGEIIIKAVDYTNGEALRLWIREVAVYKLNKFSVVVPNGVDLGNGKGLNLSNVNYNKFDMKGVFTYKAPGLYDIKFPYTYARTGNMSTTHNIVITCQGNLGVS